MAYQTRQQATSVDGKPENQVKIEIMDMGRTFTRHNPDAIQIEEFRRVNFSVNRGEQLALTGPGDVGKSSILKAIFRTYLPTSGSILFHKEDGSVVNLATCSDIEARVLHKHEIGIINRSLNILPRTTILQCVAAPLIRSGYHIQASLYRAARLLDYLGIQEEMFHVSPSSFSPAQQQLVNIASEIIVPKELLLLDDPTAPLNEKHSDLILTLLAELKKKNITMIGIFHDPDTQERIADKTYEVTREKSCLSPMAHQEAA
ncbi:MAG: ATP-binding cassette domain-containing protein [Thermodesulfobacteriota bacterium]|nr:ATP-binding cassette domain-containing protein [Thermodesulfobacteriota bacterium]